jgi:hypothetical protein
MQGEILYMGEPTEIISARRSEPRHSSCFK